MSAIIDGSDAKILWANGAVLELKRMTSENAWRDLTSQCSLAVFENKLFHFRVKPVTIDIYGATCPAPYHPVLGDKVWVLTGEYRKGYRQVSLSNAGYNTFHLGAWRTEEEIQQVVKALSKVLLVTV